MKFGKVLRLARVRSDISVAELAERSGWSRTYVHRVEASENLTEATVRRYVESIGYDARLSVIGELGIEEGVVA